MNDRYSRLKARGATPADECCSCGQLGAVYLAHVLSDNPIHCASCRGEIAPERIGFDEETTEVIARWNTLYGSVYALWLDSGSYEAWAEAELRNQHSEINRAGLRARESLARYVSASYLWFWHETRPTCCPLCGSSDLAQRGQLLSCEKCGVSV